MGLFLLTKLLMLILHIKGAKYSCIDLAHEFIQAILNIYYFIMFELNWSKVATTRAKWYTK